MIEFFIIKNIVNNLRKESFKIKERFANNEDINSILNRESKHFDILMFLTSLAVLFVSILTSKHAYNCSSNSDTFTRIISMLFAFFFTGLYMVWYFVKNALLKNKC